MRVAPGAAQSSPAAPNRFAPLHLGASRLAHFAAALRPLAAALRAERRAWVSSVLTGDPQLLRATPPQSIAPCAPRRCVAALGHLAACRASRLGQLSAARRPTAASRHSTSEHPALCISPLRRSPWPPRCVQRASRLVQLSAARRPTAASRHSTLEHRVLGSSPLLRGPWLPRCV